jgi:hypothetical protein
MSCVSDSDHRAQLDLKERLVLDQTINTEGVQQMNFRYTV